MRRFYLPPDDWLDGWPCALEGDEAHHCRRVMRVERGDEIEVIDGAGRSARVRVDKFAGKRVELVGIGEPAFVPRPNPLVHLACAIPKGKNIDLVIQKATELGVDRLTPVITERTIARPGTGNQLSGKLEKWQRIGLESTKQCGRRWLPEIMEPVAWQDFLPSLCASSVSFVCSLEKHSLPLRHHFDSLGGEKVLRSSELVLAVGPEGDFSPDEYQAARKAGFHDISLGNFVLRAETAAIAALAILANELHSICSTR